MKEFYRNYKNLVNSIGINFLLIFFAIFIFGTRYATDDDISIARIAYGTFFDGQSRVVFSGMAFGTLLKLLSFLDPRLNWQLVIYYVVLFLGGVVSLSLVIKKRDKILIYIWTLIVVIFYYSVYVSINFSLVSAMLAFYGYASLYIGVQEKDNLAIGISIIPLSFSTTIRYDSFFGVSAFAFVSFVMVVAKVRGNRDVLSVIKSYFVPFIIGLSLPMLLFISDKLSYTSDEWKAYITYNDDRAQILDFPSVLKTGDEEYFNSLGLTQDMVYSIANWQFNDPEIFSRETIAKMSEDSKKLFPKVNQDFVFEVMGYCVEKTGKLYYFLFSIIMLFLLTVSGNLVKKGTVSIYVFPWIIVVPYIIELGSFYYLDRGIDRVFRTVSIGLWSGMFALQASGYFDNDKKEELSVCFRIGCIVMLAISLICQRNELTNIRGFEIVDIEQADRKLEYLDDGKVYMCDVGALREIEEEYGIWNVPAEKALYNCVELGGWLINYPKAIEKQDALGVSNPYKSLAYNDNAYLLTIDNGELQLEYLRSAYDENIEKQFIEKHGEISVYKYSVK